MSQKKLTIQELFTSREAGERLHVEALWRRIEWELARLSIPVQDRLRLLAGFVGRNTTPEQLAQWIAAVEDAAAHKDPGERSVKRDRRNRK